MKIGEIEFFKVEVDDVSAPEPCRIKHEDTEEHTGWCPFWI